MEPSKPRSEPVCWTPPQWLERHFLPDRRFARAYNALADDRRALLKGLIARHYVLNPPRSARTEGGAERFDLFEHRVESAPAPLLLLLTDALFDSPALFLAALLPALTARVRQVLVLRLGGKSVVPDTLLAACELAGQERMAALGPVLLQRLLLECARSGTPGVILHPDTPAFRRLLAQPDLRAALDASPLRLAPLRLPSKPGLWRDSWPQFPPEIVTLLYGALPFEVAGARPGKPSRTVAPDELAWKAFNLERELLLAPEARGEQSRALVTVGEACLGQWRWPGLSPDLFRMERHVYGSST